MFLARLEWALRRAKNIYAHIIHMLCTYLFGIIAWTEWVFVCRLTKYWSQSSLVIPVWLFFDWVFINPIHLTENTENLLSITFFVHFVVLKIKNNSFAVFSQTGIEVHAQPARKRHEHAVEWFLVLIGWLRYFFCFW